MTFEKSCGAVLFTIIDGEIQYLLVQQKAGFFSFPKGHVEGEESERETALREIKEEVGVSAYLIGDFREISEYYIPSADVQKQVVFFVGEYKDQQFTPQESELLSAQLCSYEKAMSLIVHDNTKRILTLANSFIISHLSSISSRTSRRHPRN